MAPAIRPEQLSLFDIAITRVDSPTLSDVDFDYGVGEIKSTTIFTPEPEPKGIVQELDIQYSSIDQYLIDAVDGFDYGKTFENDYDSIMFINDAFESEYYKQRERYYKNNKQKAFKDWIAGLPSCFNIDFINEEIFALSSKWGFITKDSDEDQFENFTIEWFSFISKHFFMLLKDFEKLAPVSDLATGILKNCVIDGMVVRLPEVQLDRNVYVEVKNKLELIGGKWKGGKVSGFIFNEDPSELLEQIANGENRNLKKEFQFFGTPDILADQLVSYAEIKTQDRICEPSAGQGAIVKAIQRATSPNRTVEGFELMPLNQTFLKKIDGFNLLGSDFLTGCGVHFDKIIANPPFAKNQDIDHIKKMYDSLNHGGRLVSVSSVHWQNSTNKKETEFREWLKEKKANVIPVEAGAFKESGTTIPTAIIIIDRT